MPEAVGEWWSAAMERLAAPPKWLPEGLAAALPFAMAFTAASEVVAVLSASPAPDASLAFGAFGELTLALFTVMWPLLGVTVALLAALHFAVRRPARGRPAIALVLLLTTAEGAMALHFLVRDTEILDRGWLWMVPTGFGLAQGISFAFLAAHRRARVVAMVLFALAPPVLFFFNYAYTSSFYLPTEALTAMLFMGVATAAALFARDEAQRRGVWLVGSAFLVLGIFAIASTEARTSARPMTYLHSALGRAAGVYATASSDDPRLRPTSLGTRTLDPREDGLALFDRHSGFPSVPADLALVEHDVVFILVESFRFDETTLEDPRDATTPALAALAAQGLSFRRATSPSNATFPSLTALLSMTTPSFTSIDVPPAYWTGVLRQDGPVVTDAFRAAGFQTFWVGHDFQGVFGTALRGIRRRFDEVDLIEIPHDGPSPNDGDIVDAAVREIRELRERDQRFFGLVFLSATHDAYRAHDPEAPSARPIDLYRQELHYVDGQIGRLVAELDRGGTEAGTIVIVSGDHGEAFGEHGFDYHSTTVFRAQTHVPFVVRVPGLEPRQIDAPTSNLFALPWLLRSGPPAAREAAEKVIREDIAPLMHATDGAVVVEMVSPRYQRTALRYPDYTLIYDLYGDVAQIFDAEADPNEQRDLAPRDPGLRRRFRPHLDGYRAARLAGRRFVFTPSVR